MENGNDPDTGLALHRNVIEDIQRCLYEFWRVPEDKHPLEHAWNHHIALKELLRKHKRALDFHSGVPVPPEVQFGEGILTGIGQSL